MNKIKEQVLSLDSNISPMAFHAIKAAKMKGICGRWAMMRYCQKRGIPLGLYRLACQLEAASKIAA
jgi:hypothetical protein